ncbi:MAG: spermine/spermidine synthase family protein [Myxococcaceae bacterium]|nr:spermine/spermidine synthase family protein [Myxococcaceae bacterium]
MTRLSRPIVLGLLFLSGFTGLVYELVWSKRLANLLGSSGHAHAIVLATFMGGLALGAWLFGRTADRVKRPLALYGVLELGVGAYALVFRFVLEGLGSVYLQIAPGMDPDGSGRPIAKLLLAAASLLVPTVLMGGTVPALTRYFTQRLGAAKKELSVLYAVNSLGAALGCLFAGVSLIPSDGLLKSEGKAAALNLALGAAAVLIALRSGPSGATEPSGAEAPARQYSALAVRAALVGVALSGFTAMLYEITWIRLLSIVIGGTSYAFTFILTAFILGIGLGSAWLSRREPKPGEEEPDALALFARLQVLLVATVCLALPFYGRMPYLFLNVHAALKKSIATWPLYQLLTFGFCVSVLMVPTFFLGASFPAAARVALSRVDKLGGQLGSVYLWNTVGTVLGSLLGGLLLLPVLGLEGNFAVGLGFNLLAAGIAGWASKPAGVTPLKHLWPVAAALVVVIVYGASTVGWSGVVTSSGRYREWERTFDSFDAFRTQVKNRSEVKFQRDDVFASVLVGEAGPLRYMRINGKIDASNGSDIDTQILAGHLGVLTHPGEVKRVLLVGMGAGITAGSLLTHPIEVLDVVEISPAVIEAARLFGEDNGRALDDPRCKVHIEDAKTFLLLSPEKYDLIVSVPSNPWVSGVSGLFSRDFFQVASAHLAPGGRIVQWFHTYESSDALVRLVLRTLRDTFAHGTSWVGPQDLVMLGTQEPQVVDLEQVAARMERPAVKADLLRAKTPDLATLLGRQVHSDEGQLQFAGQGPINSDDRNRLEYESPSAYYVGDFVDVRDERKSRDRGAKLELARYLAAHPLTVEQAEHVYQSYAWVHGPNDALVRSSAEQWLALAPQSDDAALAVAKAAVAQRDVETALQILDPRIAAGARRPDLVSTWLDARARQLRRASAPYHPIDLGPALSLAREVLAAHPNDVALQRSVKDAL